MSLAMLHRGPDHTGAWFDERLPVAFGHQRLSILDLSPEGHQPMHSACGRYVTVFNGEIYNFAEIKSELETAGLSPSWRGHSDTEILLAAIAQWGLIPTLKRLVGMFAIALWDKKEKMLHLTRDRLGEKPLYYGWHQQTFLFGSELKALQAFPGFKGEICREALLLFMRFGYVPAPRSIFQSIAKVLPGTIVSLSFNEAQARTPASTATLATTVFWSIQEAAQNGLANSFSRSEPEAVEQLDFLLRRTIKEQMIADVPLGAFLSGGIDSSTTVALMQTQSVSRVKTFTIGFHEKEFNEAMYAKEVAQHLGTEHTELYVSPQEILSVIPRLPGMFDEPFADSSQVPTFLVAQMTKRHVTVSLSGDGGDELFGGYTRYFICQQLWERLGLIPLPMRQFVANLLNRIPINFWNQCSSQVSDALFPLSQSENLGGKLAKLAEIMTFDRHSSLYQNLLSVCKTPLDVLRGVDSEPPSLAFASPLPSGLDFFQKMMYWDQRLYLPDDILTKVDRAGMAVSLETRMPFLDHRLVEFAWSLPTSMKLQKGQGKRILRQVLAKYLPGHLIDRKKMGFSIPLSAWLKGPLRDWSESLLSPDRLAHEGFLDANKVRSFWREHLSEKRDWQYVLWNILMFQSWLDTLKTSTFFDPQIPQMNADGETQIESKK